MIEITLTPEVPSCNACPGSNAKYVLKIGDKYGTYCIRLCPSCFGKLEQILRDGLYPIKID